MRGQPIHVNKRLVLLDHPRSCGANDSLYHRLDFAHGSSPLVRGQRRGRTLAVHGERIIPARAGPTCIAGQVPWCSTDHPRSCGANPTIYLVSFFLFRIIPARAGPTNLSQFGDNDKPDHPRSCGANATDWPTSEPAIGSSPLVRGQPGRPAWSPSAMRIIPARAGPTTPINTWID